MPRPHAAFDIAATTGVCWGEPFGIPQALTWRLDPKIPRAARGLQLMRNMRLFLKEHDIAHAYIEEPLDAHIMGRIGATIETQLQLTGFVHAAEIVCYSLNVPVTMYARQAVLQHFTGQKRYKLKDDGKRACVVMCRRLGYPIENWDEADAAALWDCGTAKTNPKQFALAGALRPAKVTKGK